MFIVFLQRVKIGCVKKVKSDDKSHLSFLFKTEFTVPCTFCFPTIELGIHILMDVLDVPHVVAGALHCPTDRAGKLIGTWDETDMPANVGCDEIFAGFAPPTAQLVSVKVSLNRPFAPFAKRQTDLVRCDEDVLGRKGNNYRPRNKLH